MVSDKIDGGCFALMTIEGEVEVEVIFEIVFEFSGVVEI